jgi:hypothetical protein
LVFDKKSFILAPVVGMWCSLRSAWSEFLLCNLGARNED